MLNKFKGYFSVKSPFHKKLSQSSLISNTDEIALEDLLYLISSFESGIKEKNPSLYYIEEYFKLALNEYLISIYTKENIDNII